jgi:hypothetical protein
MICSPKPYVHLVLVFKAIRFVEMIESDTIAALDKIKVYWALTLLAGQA